MTLSAINSSSAFNTLPWHSNLHSFLSRCFDLPRDPSCVQLQARSLLRGRRSDEDSSAQNHLIYGREAGRVVLCDGALQLAVSTITIRALSLLSSHKAVGGSFRISTYCADGQSDLLNPNLDALDDSNGTSSLEALTSRQSRRKEKNAQVLHSAADAVSSENASTSVSEQPTTMTDTAGLGAAELEEEADSEGAFNPETGEINWDCPCLGGMAHGPCGPQFREAFSCFVFSTEEPKGMDCIEKFQGMRDCFQEHPDVYKDELMDDEEIDRELEAEKQELTQQIAERHKADNETGRRLLEEAAAEPRPAKKTKNTSSEKPSKPTTTQSNEKRTGSASPSSPPDENAPPSLDSQTTTENPPAQPGVLAAEASTSGDDVVPKAAHDASAAKAPSDEKAKG